jgi:hypothetical protein
MMYNTSTSRKLVLGKSSIIMGKEIYQANQVKENGLLTCKMPNMKEISRENLSIPINCLFRMPM